MSSLSRHTAALTRSLRHYTSLPSPAQSLRLPTPPPTPLNPSFATVSILGYPSAGKSTLLNRLIGTRLAAVSRKRHTTRRRITGVLTAPPTQLVFLDTPGITHGHLGAVRRPLVRAAYDALADADVALVVVDASRPDEHWADVARLVKQLDAPRLALVLNKADVVRHRALAAADFFATALGYDALLSNRPFITSASSGRGVDEVRDALLGAAQPGAWEYAPGAAAAAEDERDIVLEHVWQAFLHRAHQEIPYHTDFEIEEWKDVDWGVLVKIVFRVERPAQVPIVVGPGGDNVRFIAEEAGKSASEVLGRRVFLRLRVVAKKSKGR